MILQVLPYAYSLKSIALQVVSYARPRPGTTPTAPLGVLPSWYCPTRITVQFLPDESCPTSIALRELPYACPLRSLVLTYRTVLLPGVLHTVGPAPAQIPPRNPGTAPRSHKQAPSISVLFCTRTL